jgi:hypothetical protein
LPADQQAALDNVGLETVDDRKVFTQTMARSVEHIKNHMDILPDEKTRDTFGSLVQRAKIQNPLGRLLPEMLYHLRKTNLPKGLGEKFTNMVHQSAAFLHPRVFSRMVEGYFTLSFLFLNPDRIEFLRDIVLAHRNLLSATACQKVVETSLVIYHSEFRKNYQHIRLADTIKAFQNSPECRQKWTAQQREAIAAAEKAHDDQMKKIAYASPIFYDREPLFRTRMDLCQKAQPLAPAALTMMLDDIAAYNQAEFKKNEQVQWLALVRDQIAKRSQIDHAVYGPTSLAFQQGFASALAFLENNQNFSDEMPRVRRLSDFFKVFKEAAPAGQGGEMKTPEMLIKMTTRLKSLMKKEDVQ